MLNKPMTQGWAGKESDISWDINVFNWRLRHMKHNRPIPSIMQTVMTWLDHLFFFFLRLFILVHRARSARSLIKVRTEDQASSLGQCKKHNSAVVTPYLQHWSLTTCNGEWCSTCYRQHKDILDFISVIQQSENTCSFAAHDAQASK